MILPRPYQERAIKAGVDYLRGNFYDDAGLIVAPTGCGKSVIIANIIPQLEAPCLVFQPSREILIQNSDKLRGYGYEPAIWSASLGRKEKGAITLATIGSVIRTKDAFTDVRYVIVDECDLVNAKGGMYAEFIAANPQARILGLTATPYRLSTDGYGGSILKYLTRTRPRIFKHTICVIQNRELFDAGYLAKLEYKEVKTGFDATKLRSNSTGADYTEASVLAHFRELDFNFQIVRCVERLHELGRKGVLVFTSFVEDAEEVARRIPGAVTVSSETPAGERSDIIAAFKAGTIPVVANVGVLAVGFDYPALANVVLARPTMSLRLYYQQVGRCVRTHESKSESFVIDMVGLVQRFGRVEDLELRCGPRETWALYSGARQLTNQYFGDPKALEQRRIFIDRQKQRHAQLHRTAEPEYSPQNPVAVSE